MNDVAKDGERHGAYDQPIRASDAERERTAALLKEHVLNGRLTTAEYSERLDATYTARTRGELRDLLADLPPTGAAESPSQPNGPSRRGIHPIVVVAALVGAVWLSAWLLGGGPARGFFPIWPLLIWGFVLFRWGGRRLRPRR